MKWIRNHKLISFLVTIVAASFIILVLSVSAGGKSDPVSRTVNTVVTTIEKPFVALSDLISGNVTGIFSYREYQEENERLRKENAELKKEITATALSAKELQELKDLATAVNYDLKDVEVKLVTADVTATSLSGATWMNVFTINRGTESGISEGNIVVYGSGLVGRVISTSKGWSKISSITDESNKASFSVAGKLDIVGVIEKAEDGLLDGYMLDNKAKVEEGDALITTGMGRYPAGLEIGKIVKTKYDSNSQLLRVTVKPAVDFRTLQKVSVII